MVEGGENLQEAAVLISLSASIISVDDLFKNVQALDNIYSPWQRANFASLDQSGPQELAER